MRWKNGLPTCPICVRWICGVYGCGWNSRQTADGRKPLPERTCNACGSADGEYLPVMHYRKDIHDAHMYRARQEECVHPVDQERINDVAALLEMISPHLTMYRALVRENRYTTPGSFESNSVINRGNETLLKIDSTIREWIRKGERQDAC